MKEIIIIKNNGEEEKFNKEKIKKSLERSGLKNQKDIEEILSNIEKRLKDRMTTSKIYEILREELKKKSNKKAFFRYNLPLAISKLGPEGFAFEKFIGEVFKAYNYNPVYIGKKINGKCIIHEMDIVAERHNELLTAELKFHNSRSKKTDLKVILYMKARFDDILNADYYKDKIPNQIIITNTKFTQNAKIYAKCAGVRVLSWNFPESSNLHDFILNSGVHPLTALTSLSTKAKEYFVKNKIVSCKNIIKNDMELLRENPFVPKKDLEKVKEEIETLLNNYNKINF